MFRDWFAGRGWAPRAHQLAMVEKARLGRDALLIAPTGGGKTLAGFLPSLVELHGRGPVEGAGVHTLYISPLKALAVDVQRNLETPAREMGLAVSIESRTGDTSVGKRQRQRERPPDILLTTPEQLALFCAWEGSREYFKDLRRVVVDEAHALQPSKRGDLLALGVSRLRALAPAMTRVGLSATVEDPEMLGRWLGPEVDLVRGEPGAPASIEVLLSENRVPWSGITAQHAMPEVYAEIQKAATTLVFVNTRWQSEFAFQELWRLNEDNLPIAIHHGSLSAEQRRKVEAAMARNELRAVVATSTLDLGIDWGAVDLVIQLSAPKGASRLVQRIGRANHRLDEPSRALLTPANRFEMLECQAAREAVSEGALDGETARTGALDVLAQHVMGVACGDPFEADALFAEVRTAAPFAELTREDFDSVVEFVSTGGYSLKVYDRFRRIVQGADGLWRARNGLAAQRHRMNVGAIHAASTLNIRVRIGKGRGGRKIGEAEEFFFEQITVGDTFLFSGEVWKFEGVVGVDALVSPAKDKEPRILSWGGSKFALSTYLAGRVRRMIADEDSWIRLPGDVQEWLHAQKSRSLIPREDELLIETYPRGKRFYMVCYPFEGRLAHTTLAMLLARRLDREGVGPLGYVCNDYALAMWAVRPFDSLDFGDLFQQDMLGDDLEAWLDESYLMKRAFRGCATISGLIERRFPGAEKSGRQVTFSTDLVYDVLRRHQPDHLLLKAARADANSSSLDIRRLGTLLARAQGRLRPMHLPKVSPFAVQPMLEIGRERIAGSVSDFILAEAEEDLIADAMS